MVKVEINALYDEITPEMSDYINANNLEIIKEGDKFKVIPYVPPIAQQVAELETKLDNDYRYKKYLDGEYSDFEWEEISSERRGWREKLRKLKSQLEITNGGL